MVDGGGASYSAQALAAQGWTPGATKTVDGVNFTWPQSTPGWPDNVVAQGQNITVNAPSGTQTLAFLASITRFGMGYGCLLALLPKWWTN